MTAPGGVAWGDLQSFCVVALEAVGAPRGSAETVAASLIDADLRGLDSHGVVARLPGYVARVHAGGIVPGAEVVTVRGDAGPVALLDGGDGFGQVAGVAATQLALELANGNGVGIVAVRGSNHLGALGYYTRMLAAAGAVGHAASGGGPRIAPWGGAEPLLATNPWSFAFPATDRPPMVVDVSNGVVLTGQVDGPAAAGGRIPLGWALDQSGLPTEDAAAGAAGSLLPFGGAKGAALTLALEALVSVLTGAAFSRHVPSLADPTQPQRLGHLFMALPVESFQSKQEFHDRMEQLLQWVETSRPVEGGPTVRVPGMRGEATAGERRRSGIPLSGRRIALDQLADELGIARLSPSG